MTQLLFPADLTLIWSGFHGVGVATEKVLVPTFVLTLGTKSGLQLNDRSCLGCLVVSSEYKYAGCLGEYLIGNCADFLKIMRYRTESQFNDLRSGTE